MTEIKATIIQDSINSYTGARLITYELEYPRFIHSELMTHKMLAKNCASSRAIPIQKTIDQITENPASPVFWGKNQSGMQAAKELEMPELLYAKVEWQRCADRAVVSAKALQELDLHKQIVNRVMEPFVWMKTVLTGTEFNNFFWLRKDPGAQPEFKRLAELMYEARENSKPILLYHNEWHIPYITRTRKGYDDPWNDKLLYSCGDEELTVEQSLKLSASLCAQTSYRKSDDTLEKAYDIYNRLVGSEPVHASPFEHQGMCYNVDSRKMLIALLDGLPTVKGITHVDIKGNWWSANLRNFIQYRQLIPNNAKYG